MLIQIVQTKVPCALCFICLLQLNLAQYALEFQGNRAIKKMFNCLYYFILKFDTESESRSELLFSI